MLTLLPLVDKFGIPTFVSSAARFVERPFDAVPVIVEMSSRLLIPVLCLGAVAFACGPRAHNEASTPRKDSVAIAQSIGTASAPAIQQGAPIAASKPQSKSAKSKVAAQLFVRAQDSELRLALHVVNTTKKRIEITFPTGQTHDFVVLDSVGREVWRWGRGRMFTQTLRNKLLGGGETLELEEQFASKPLPPGRYTARAVLTSANYPVEQQIEFTITGTTIASR